MKTIFVAALFATLLSGAACSPPAQPGAEETATDMSAMENTAPAAAGAIESTGVVTAIDAAAGTISLDHQAIPAVSWPAMTMQFTAEDPTILQGIAVGDRVLFQLKSATETSVVTMIHKQ